MVLNLELNEDTRYAIVDRLRYHDYEPDFDLMQFDNVIYLNDEDIY
jgi:hypothetical protein